MQIPNRTGTSKRLNAGAALFSWLLVLVGGLFVISWIYALFTVVTTGTSEEVPASALLVFLVLIALSVVLGVRINRRYPGHAIGLLFLVMAYSGMITIIVYGMQLLNESRVLGYSFLMENVAIIVGETLYFPMIFTPLLLMPLFFPTGKLLSRRWRPLVGFLVFGICWIFIERTLHPWPAPSLGITATRSWNGIPGSEPFFGAVNAILAVPSLLVVPLVLLAVFLRYRQSTGIERTQMKWPIFATGLTAVLFVVHVAVPEIARFNEGSGYIVTLMLTTLVPLSIGIAILRYRLFDIDVIIRRTVQYGIVTALLALVYFGLVVTFQTFVSDLGGEQSAIFIVISTLVIAALFNPLRLRVQAAVDRRFYRQKYQAEQALAQFATAARDEVELDRLTAALMVVVEETMQPEQASLVLVKQDADRMPAAAPTRASLTQAD